MCRKQQNMLLFQTLCQSPRHTDHNVVTMTSPVKASPCIPLDVISGLRFWTGPALFFRVEKPPKPWSKMPSWKPRAPLRLGDPNIATPPSESESKPLNQSFHTKICSPEALLLESFHTRYIYTFVYSTSFNLFPLAFTP